MKNKLVFLILIFFIFTVIVGVFYFTQYSKSKSGVLKVLSSPRSEVYVDNKQYGTTPFEKTFSEGEYIVSLKPDKFSSEAASWKGKVIINDNTVTYINRDIGTSDISSSGIILSMSKDAGNINNNTGILEIESEPSGAIVSLDGVEQGITHTVLRNIDKGDHEMTIYNPGFIRRSEKIRIEPNYKITAIVKLAIDPAFKNISEDQLIQPTQTASASAQTSVKKLIIRQTETGWLRVRDGPTIATGEAGRVNPGQEFMIIDQQSGWYKIEYSKDKYGWVINKYVDVVTPTP
jgi:hypothetical protein